LQQFLLFQKFGLGQVFVIPSQFFFGAGVHPRKIQSNAPWAVKRPVAFFRPFVRMTL
jgi:hypothetical protein